MILYKTNIALLATGLLTVACNQHVEQRPPSERQSPSILQTVAAARIEITETTDVAGTVRPVQHATLQAQVAGTITTLRAKSGTTVNDGDLLAEIDAAEFKARVRRAETEVALAQKELNRVERLAEKNAATNQDLDRARAQADRAKAELEEASTLETHTKILAPFAGTIIEKFVDEGDMAMPGRPLFELESSGGFRLETQVPESLVNNIHLGDLIDVSIGSRILQATVDEMSPAVDTMTRTRTVKLLLPDSFDATTGQFGRARIPTGTSDPLVIPRTAMNERGQIEMLHVAVDGVTTARVVRSGRRFGDRIEILSGITEGEQVVTKANPSTLAP